MFDLFKNTTLENIDDNVIDIKFDVKNIINELRKKDSGTGKVIDIVKLGYQPVEKNQNFPICKKKIAIMKDDKPEVREISVSSTSDYIRVIDTSDAGREFVLSIDEIVALADKHGLFR